jgi:DNA repair exonuclease SbcCD ATPase subunit
MDPIKLSLENFCSHSKSEIDFSDFSTALIIGKIRGNDKFSNGAGKSTIFTAIKYVLFNEIEYSTLDKVIRHNTDYCRVAFEFKAYDQEIYKIIRSRSKKSGSDIRLFKKNQENWEDLTQRRGADTEIEIEKIIKTNYKTFCNSFIFSQSDFSGIASTTPEKRKSALKEVLQLNIYSKFEILAKKKTQEIVKEIEKKKVIISTIGNPQEDIDRINIELSELNQKISLEEVNLLHLNNEIEKNNLLLIDLQSQEKDIKNKSTDKISGLKGLENKLLNINNDINEYTKKVLIVKENGVKISSELELIKTNLAKNNSLTLRNISDILAELNSTKSLHLDKKIKIKTILSEIDKLSLPIPKDSKCKHCRQVLTEEHKKICQSEIDKELYSLLDIKNITLNENIILSDKENKLSEELEYTKNILSENKSLSEKILYKNKEIEEKRNLYVEYLNSLDKLKKHKEDIEHNIFEIQKEFSQENINKLEEIVSLISKYQGLADKYKNALLSINKNILAISNNIAVIINNKNKREQDLENIKVLSNELAKYEEKFSIHQKVSQAFSSTGIPALIIHNILDDLQIESNNLISEIRSGLQLQFVISKDKTNGEQEDTLDIIYMINGFNIEYAQLSSAQKLIVSLGLKLGLASVLKKRLGIDVKLLLIDEADQSLDEAGIEAFEDCIKKLQKEYKILIITHNISLKDKFSHIIVVEQDEESISTAKVVNSW